MRQICLLFFFGGGGGEGGRNRERVCLLCCTLAQCYLYKWVYDQPAVSEDLIMNQFRKFPRGFYFRETSRK